MGIKLQEEQVQKINHMEYGIKVITEFIAFLPTVLNDADAWVETIVENLEDFLGEVMDERDKVLQELGVTLNSDEEEEECDD